jgi:hypothetical protein
MKKSVEIKKIFDSFDKDIQSNQTLSDELSKKIKQIESEFDQKSQKLFETKIKIVNIENAILENSSEIKNQDSTNNELIQLKKEQEAFPAKIKKIEDATKESDKIGKQIEELQLPKILSSSLKSMIDILPDKILTRKEKNFFGGETVITFFEKKFKEDFLLLVNQIIEFLLKNKKMKKEVSDSLRDRISNVLEAVSIKNFKDQIDILQLLLKKPISENKKEILILHESKKESDNQLEEYKKTYNKEFGDILKDKKEVSIFDTYYLAMHYMKKIEEKNEENEKIEELKKTNIDLAKEKKDLELKIKNFLSDLDQLKKNKKKLEIKKNMLDIEVMRLNDEKQKSIESLQIDFEKLFSEIKESFKKEYPDEVVNPISKELTLILSIISNKKEGDLFFDLIKLVNDLNILMEDQSQFHQFLKKMNDEIEIYGKDKNSEINLVKSFEAIENFDSGLVSMKKFHKMGFFKKVGEISDRLNFISEEIQKEKFNTKKNKETLKFFLLSFSKIKEKLGMKKVRFIKERNKLIDVGDDLSSTGSNSSEKSINKKIEEERFIVKEKEKSNSLEGVINPVNSFIEKISKEKFFSKYEKFYPLILELNNLSTFLKDKKKLDFSKMTDNGFIDLKMEFSEEIKKVEKVIAKSKEKITKLPSSTTTYTVKGPLFGIFYNPLDFLGSDIKVDTEQEELKAQIKKEKENIGLVSNFIKEVKKLIPVKENTTSNKKDANIYSDSKRLNEKKNLGNNLMTNYKK